MTLLISRLQSLCIAANPHHIPNFVHADLTVALNVNCGGAIIAYVFGYAGGKNVAIGWRVLDYERAAKVMRIQDFVIIPGSVPGPKDPTIVTSAIAGAAAEMTPDEERELKAQLVRLRQEHRDLDVAIEALHNSPSSDLLQVQRLKKRKLVLRDRIIAIEDQLTPDIIA